MPARRQRPGPPPPRRRAPASDLSSWWSRSVTRRCRHWSSRRCCSAPTWPRPRPGAAPGARTAFACASQPGAQCHRQRLRTDQPGRRPGSEQFRASLDAGWELDLWGGGAAGLRAAEAGVRASDLTLAQTPVAVAAEAALALLQLRGTQARLAIAQRNLASQQQTLQITQWRQGGWAG
ncbi:MAG: TolC family protein [Betaproteobacteria bacterium]|nr:TolC family protein [Betaproteobacteria bacterium]